MKKLIGPAILMLVVLFVGIVALAILPTVFGIWGVIANILLVIMFVASCGIFAYQCIPAATTSTHPKLDNIKKVSKIVRAVAFVLLVVLIVIYGAFAFSKYFATNFINHDKETVDVVQPTPTPIVTEQPAENQNNNQNNQQVEPTPAPKAQTIEWKYGGYEAAFTPGKGHRMYETKFVDGKATKYNRYYKPDRYILLDGETLNPSPKPEKPTIDEQKDDEAKQDMAKLPQPWYDDTATHCVKNYTWTLTVKSGDIGIISGVYVKLTNSSGKVLIDNNQPGDYQGVYAKLSPGTYKITITDGFVLTIDKDYANDEWNARLKQADANNWARHYVYSTPLN